MKQWPDFNGDGDLPIGIHRATLIEVIEHFGTVHSVAKLFLEGFNESIPSLRVLENYAGSSFSVHSSPGSPTQTMLTFSC